MDSPTLYVIAGPNGIGKTTSDFDLFPKNIPIINSDEIAAEIKKTGTVPVNVQEFANREGLRVMDGYLQKRVSFVIETNRADVDTWKSLLQIQVSGYNLHVLYISTDSLDILNSRIEARQRMGGHFVRPDIVRERYLAGLNLLYHYQDRPDRLLLFDNAESMRLVVELRKGQIVAMQEKLPAWATQYMGQVASTTITPEMKARDMDSIDEVRKRYLEGKRGLEGKPKSEAPGESKGKTRGRGR